MLKKMRAAKAQAAEQGRQVVIDKQAQCAATRGRLRLEKVQGWPTDDCNTDCGPWGKRPCD